MVRPWYWPKGGQPHRTEPFTWIVKGKMASGWWPESREIERYKKEGIKVVINCSEFDNQQEVRRRRGESSFLATISISFVVFPCLAIFISVDKSKDLLLSFLIYQISNTQ